MKSLFTLLALCFAFSALAEVTYPVKNYSYISDWDYREEVEQSDKYVVMVFSSKNCLERVIIERNCFLFEKKLDYFIPSFSKNVKVVGFNTYFENYQIASQFYIQKTPTVIILKDNQIIERFESDYARPDVVNGRVGWEDELLKQVLNTVYKIR